MCFWILLSEASGLTPTTKTAAETAQQSGAVERSLTNVLFQAEAVEVKAPAPIPGVSLHRW